MRRPQRLIAATVLAAIALALAGCSGGNFDPTDLMDVFDTKKKLPGDRKPVFPEGVPGVEQGVPKDLYKGAQQQQQDQPPVADVAPPPAPKSRKAAARRSQSRCSRQRAVRSRTVPDAGGRSQRAAAEDEEAKADPHYRATARC